MNGIYTMQEDERWTFLREARAARAGVLTEEAYEQVTREERQLLGFD